MEGQVEQVLGALRDVLGRELVGAYLHGSAVLGGLRPHSDVDVLAVSARPTTRDERSRLAVRLGELSGRRAPVPGRPVELTIVVAAAVRPWRAPGRLDFQYGEWLRDEFERGNLEPWSEEAHADVAVLIAIALLGNVALSGPPPRAVFDTIPPRDLAEAMVGGLDGLLLDVEDDTRNVLLTLARIWCTLATGEIRSKDRAATWAVERLPDEHRQPLDRARAIYLGEEEERWDDVASRVAPLAARMTTEIRRLERDEALPGAPRR